MKNIFATIALLLVSTISFGQIIVSGEYGSGLKLAFDIQTHKLTGYFEN